MVLAEAPQTRKANPYIQHLFHSDQNAIPALMEVIHCNAHATVWWADSLRSSNILGVHCWSLKLADRTLSSDCRWISFDKWRLMPLSPCIIFTLTSLASLFMSPLGKDRNG